MRKLALSDEILLSVEKPARYIGGEVNSVVKDIEKDHIDIRFAMCFPDVYEIGMSHLGIQILYDMFNRMDGVWCERVYSPWPDLDKIMREKRIPLFGLESQEPVKNLDFLGITLQYEMCYTNVLQVLDLSGIPLLSKDRTWDDPIVLGGGPCTYNPEPLAPFFDIFYMGEGETRYEELINLYREARKNGLSRLEFLRKAALIPGLYVPSLYDVTYNEDGTFQEMIPLYPEAPKTVVKEVVMDLDHVPYPDKPVVPFIQVTQDRVTLEIMRGCIRGCRFCQAGMIYRPVRERSLEFLKEKATAMLRSTGHEEITLSSLSSSDYTHLGELVNFLIDEFKSQGVNISLPSLRIDAFSLDVMSKVQDIRKSSVTFAPEAGTQRMRNVINKGLTTEDILNGSREAFSGGWNKVKLYFMLGLPTETEEDMVGIAELANEVAAVYYDTVPKEQRQGRCQITASSSFFIPKPFTGLQWARMYPKEEYARRAHIVKDAMNAQLNHKSLHYQYHETDVSVLEGVFARGDRRIADVILAAYRRGSLFDAWSEFYDDEKWQQSFKECGLDPDFYTMRERPIEEAFPWDFIDTGVTKAFLIREWQRAHEPVITPNCRQKCQGCGARRFGGGVCFEGQS